jgi:RimJ/RimL family protein N-acetyltransferase
MGLLGAALVNGPGPAEEGKVRQLTRVNFRFEKEKFMASQKAAPGPPHKVIPTSREHFDRMQGKVIPRFFWRDADHFIREGAGYTMVVDGEPVSTAFSAFTAPGILEFGIETAEGHRGKGYAEHVCHALMRHCLERGLEPVWACREDNAGSMRLAQRLGFVPTIRVPYYLLAQASP